MKNLKRVLVMVLVATLMSCSVEEVQQDCECEVFATAYSHDDLGEILVDRYLYKTVQMEWCDIYTYSSNITEDGTVLYPEIIESQAWVKLEYECKRD